MADEKEKEITEKGANPPEDEPKSREEAAADMESFFAALEEKTKGVPKDELERGAEKVRKFIDGKMSWAELFNFTPEMLYQMAEHGFVQFKQGRYQDAERIFKVLTVLDWNNPYYHSVMGSILQRQKRYGEAIAEYTQALDLDANDIVSHTNRGEILMQHGLLDDAEADFERAASLDPSGENRFSNRARMLLGQIHKRRGEAKGGRASEKKRGG
ncbi:MAG: tetratricopeptide repeat protein [Proteobacteria bacterium]|nr:tetratricopeptide repeat protein [Pseudomonadota bacterium]